MSLTEYKRKRHFSRTPEPEGKKARGKGNSFVIQKHAASHLHYDFRLELDGVLKSWAVPKGPSLDPSVKRLAMHVEDHPVAYGTFEGTIPQGEYGGGTVMLWDQGTWEAVEDANEGYQSGRLKFELFGKKLKGRWMLVRTHGRGGKSDDRQWLLFKERDGEATSDFDILEQEPNSIKTGRTMEEIAAKSRKVWRSKPSANGKKAAAVKKKQLSEPSTRPSKDIGVHLATLADAAPTGDEWLHEIKFDGYRMICRVEDGQVDFISRNNLNWTRKFASLVQVVKKLKVKQAIIDGEVVALRPDGISDFQELQNRLHEGDQSLVYYVFDLLQLNGENVSQLPLIERKEKLAGLIEKSGSPPQLRYSEHVEGRGTDFFEQACRKGLEGIICKRADRPYIPGRSQQWLKVKCAKADEFVIGGYSDPNGAREKFGALLLGFYDKKGKLHYAGKVGTGFNETSLQTVFDRLTPLQQSKSPFANNHTTSPKVHWVQPILVAQITYGSMTRDKKLRHSSFQGLREDKPAQDVKQETPLATSKMKTTTKKRATTKKKSTKAKTKAAHSPGAAETLLAGVRLTHPDKILFPDQGITKMELAEYYRSVAHWILPHLVDRPLVLVRCPEGQGTPCFFQKHPAIGTPDSLRRIPIKEKTKSEEYVVVDDEAGLISLAQIGALEIHSWGSRADKLDQPDRLIFDLDPAPDVSWKTVIESAGQVRDFLSELGLKSFPRTTGGKGIHIVVPIARRFEWDDVKAFCKQVADLIVAADPAHYTANMSKAARTGKIFIDYLRNGRGASAIASYSTRAKSDAPVATPMTWNELKTQAGPAEFTIRNISKRLTKLKRDPWQGIESLRQELGGPIKQVNKLARG